MAEPADLAFPHCDILLPKSPLNPTPRRRFTSSSSSADLLEIRGSEIVPKISLLRECLLRECYFAHHRIATIPRRMENSSFHYQAFHNCQRQPSSTHSHACASIHGHPAFRLPRSSSPPTSPHHRAFSSPSKKPGMAVKLMSFEFRIIPEMHIGPAKLMNIFREMTAPLVHSLQDFTFVSIIFIFLRASVKAQDWSSTSIHPRPVTGSGCIFEAQEDLSILDVLTFALRPTTIAKVEGAVKAIIEDGCRVANWVKMMMCKINHRFSVHTVECIKWEWDRTRSWTTVRRHIWVMKLPMLQTTSFKVSVTTSRILLWGEAEIQFAREPILNRLHVVIVGGAGNGKSTVALREDFSFWAWTTFAKISSCCPSLARPHLRTWPPTSEVKNVFLFWITSKRIHAGVRSGFLLANLSNNAPSQRKVSPGEDQNAT
ncbi:hypothetical protein BT69DRAFT_1305959 [Atractiella rhizophila]|nr:hypothetical protein BT69DRAFT_1305959 [Atractiella rhizophila]